METIFAHYVRGRQKVEGCLQPLQGPLRDLHNDQSGDSLPPRTHLYFYVCFGSSLKACIHWRFPSRTPDCENELSLPSEQSRAPER